MVQLIMTETDIECGHTKTTLYARGVNKSCRMGYTKLCNEPQ